MATSKSSLESMLAFRLIKQFKYLRTLVTEQSEFVEEIIARITKTRTQKNVRQAGSCVLQKLLEGILEIAEERDAPGKDEIDETCTRKSRIGKNSRGSPGSCRTVTPRGT